MLLVPFTRMVSIQKTLCLISSRKVSILRATILSSILCLHNMVGPKQIHQISCHQHLKIIFVEEGQRKGEKENSSLLNQEKCLGWPQSHVANANCRGTSKLAVGSL